MIRIALGIEYDGTGYHGWQKQLDLISIQAVLEAAISKIADQEIKIYCAGRTDAKVHATGQVIHFDYVPSLNNNKIRDLKAWTRGVNSVLPNDIAVSWAKVVDNNFHARFSAIARQYKYTIYCHEHIKPLLNNQALWVYRQLDVEKMQQACKYLLGEQDFSCFRSSECQAKTPVKNIIFANIMSNNGFIVLDIKANAFLHHMVRNIVGCLLAVGLNNRPPEWIAEIIQLKDRKKAAKTAPAHGLCLVAVDYLTS
jgi:tRNA pseudouridine38-40 synthase